MTRRIDSPDTDADIELRGYLDSDTRTSFIMVAGAGSGKTTSLVKALAHIGGKFGAELRRRHQQVACITYTEIAVKEIWGDVGNNSLFHVSTIHSFLWSLIKPFQKDIAIWVRQRMEAKLTELREEKKNFGPRVHQKTRDKNQREIDKLEIQLATIGEVKRFKYENGSDYSKGILGHNDIIVMVPQLIKDRPLLASIIAQKYPFFFVDESQDTLENVVEALRTVARQMAGKYSLGFFGDPMQKIYVSGVGDIELDVGWKLIKKPENFRCPTTVLSVINNIRAQGDGLVQTRGRQSLINNMLHPVPGTAKLFILPADENRSLNLDLVRTWLADTYGDVHWTSDSREADVRILVIVHRMAAARLGFPDLYSAFNDGATESFKASFSEGTAWPLKPFLDVLQPLSLALAQNRQFDVMKLLRTHCPRLDKDSLKDIDNFSELLTSLKDDVRKLAELMSETSNATILDVLRFTDQVHLIKLDERLKEYVVVVPAGNPEDVVPPLPTEPILEDGDEDKTAASIAAYLACPAKQLWGYHTYINDQSPYSTQQGIKGAEFERVLVVLDDEEGRHFQFSYDKLLGLKEPSKTDIDNQNQSKETVYDRTRRLFYVCCSRATKDLAVVLYSDNVEFASAQLKSAALFQPADIHTLDDIS